MATGLQARAVAANDPTFQLRCAESAAEAAVAIYNEAPTVTGHAARAAFANQVLRSPGGQASSFSFALVGQGLDTTSSDAAINTGVASVWNALANA